MTPQELIDVQQAIIAGIKNTAPALKDVSPALTPAVVPSYKTSEFWGHVAVTVLALVIASGIIPTSGLWAQIAALVMAGLSSAGYSVSRGLAKCNAPRK